MRKGAIFISHSTRDDAFAEELRHCLGAKGFYNLLDPKELRGGKERTKRIFTAIEKAMAFIVIISPDAFNSAWVAEETRYAAQVKERRKNHFSIIPLLRQGVELGALKWIFSKKPLAIRVMDGPEGIRKAMPQILSALGERVTNDPMPIEAESAAPVDELLLELSSPSIQVSRGRQELQAKGELIYVPSSPEKPFVHSREAFRFVSPVFDEEINELHWFLEKHYLWPEQGENERAGQVKTNLPRWGGKIFEATMDIPQCREVVKAFQKSRQDREKRFTIFLNIRKPADRKRLESAFAACVRILNIPWELMHDGENYLFKGAVSTRGQHHLPYHRPGDLDDFEKGEQDAAIRILLVSPGQEEEVNIREERITLMPRESILDAEMRLTEISVLSPSTQEALVNELHRAAHVNRPYHAVHLDMHSMFRKQAGYSVFSRQSISPPTPWNAEEIVHILFKYPAYTFLSRSLSIPSGKG